MSGWIKCSERLPERYVAILGYGTHGFTKSREVFRVQYDGKQFFESLRKWRIDRVTHWMPLPNPPKEDE